MYILLSSEDLLNNYNTIKTPNYQTPSHVDLFNHGYKHISARPVGNNATWKCLLADSWLTGWHVPCLCCVERCCAWCSETGKEKRNIMFWEEVVFFRCFFHTTKRSNSSKNTELLLMLWDIVTVSVCSFHQFIVTLRSRNIPLKIRVTKFNNIYGNLANVVRVNIGTSVCSNLVSFHILGIVCLLLTPHLSRKNKWYHPVHPLHTWNHHDVVFKLCPVKW